MPDSNLVEINKEDLISECQRNDEVATDWLSRLKDALTADQPVKRLAALLWDIHYEGFEEGYNTMGHDILKSPTGKSDEEIENLQFDEYDIDTEVGPILGKLMALRTRKAPDKEKIQMFSTDASQH